MLEQLKAPYKGQTHVELEIDVAPRRETIEVTCRFGLMVEQESGEVFEPTFTAHRRIAGPEFRAFVELPISKGLPAEKAGNFRGDDLVEWLDTYGYAVSTWAPPEPAEPEAQP